jgi:hypothetical protein
MWNQVFPAIQTGKEKIFFEINSKKSGTAEVIK